LIFFILKLSYKYKMEIDGYENYLIYENGKVQNKKTKRFLKQQLNKEGYYQVQLRNNKKPKIWSIHRLVGLHYLESVEGKNIIDHIDRNKTNNHISNLRWCNHSENTINTNVYNSNKLGIKNIFYNQIHKYYVFAIRRNNINHTKYFKTLEECIEYRDEYLANIN